MQQHDAGCVFLISHFSNYLSGKSQKEEDEAPTYSYQIILFEASAAVNAASDAFSLGRKMNFLDAWIWGGGFPVPSLSMRTGIVYAIPSLKIYWRNVSSFGFVFLEIQQSELERGGKLCRTVPNAFPQKKRYFLFGAGTTAFPFSSRQQLRIISALIISRFLFSLERKGGNSVLLCART